MKKTIGKDHRGVGHSVSKSAGVRKVGRSDGTTGGQPKRGATKVKGAETKEAKTRSRAPSNPLTEGAITSRVDNALGETKVTSSSADGVSR